MRVRAAAYVLCRDGEGRILLTRFVESGNPNTGQWTMPGGGMEWGEQSYETAARELHEETGLTADIGGVLAVDSHWVANGDDLYHGVRIIHEATNARGELKTDFGDCDTTDAAGWFTLDEARALPHVGLVAFCLDLC